MIPARLRLRNFMCYRGDGLELDFGGMHLACLAGRNGHGKSALLDAITWSLWGKARAARDNDLVSLGEEEMEVEFDFHLGDNLYKVLRKRSLSGRGRSSLELQVAHEDRFNSLTEPTMRATQAKIDELLRMDYDTFINSAFLLQGRANEFTTKSPADRKRILGEILGLSIYDQYEQRARDLAREAETEERTMQARAAEIERELGHEERYGREAQDAEAAVMALGAELSAIGQELDQLRQEKRVLDLQRRQREAVQLRLRRAEKERDEAVRLLNTQQRRVQDLEATLAHRSEIEAGYGALQQARARDHALSEKLAQLMPLRDERSLLLQAINAEGMALQQQQRLLQERLQALQGTVAGRDKATAELESVQRKLDELEAQATQLERVRQTQQELATEKAGLEAQNGRLRQDMADIKEKIELLKQAEATCPLCGTDLDGEHQQELLADFTQQGRTRGDQYRANQTRLAEIEQQAAALKTEGERLAQGLRAQNGLTTQRARAERALQEVDEAAAELTRLQPDLQRVSEQLRHDRFAVEQRQELAAAERRIAALQYDAEAHKQARADAQQLGDFERKVQALQTADQLVMEAKEQIERLQAAAARGSQDVEQERGQLAELDAALAAAGDLEQKLAKAQAARDALSTQEANARLQWGAARQKLENCRVLVSERGRLQSQLREVAGRKGAYEELRLAFGQKGLRAMIIESVIPEIEEEANRLLARMTENRMHVRFETQRETLRGDTVETLEIQIADELGTRNYEMYSGGEAFRVDFAIRIALSKLLARRAGAQLQTLVMDEGFGTQDAQGRERLIEAINSIQDDFACILVITHIEELQDAFPVRIMVNKTAEGSRFAMA